MTIALILTAIIISLLVLEKWYLERLIKRIPIRILVNGTRGKSTVVKYLAFILRSNGKPTLSKITGIVPTKFYDDINSEVIKRRGGARVTEQFRIIRDAVKRKSEALVLENMSINPELQKIESSVFKPHYYVITNILEDHLEEFGLTPDKWVEAICSAIPANCKVITSDTEHLQVIKKYAHLKNSSVLFCSDEQINDKDELHGLHPDNLRIAETFAGEENLSIKPLYKKLNDIHKNDLVMEKEINGFKVKLINAFAANDVPSAKKILESSKESVKNKFLLFNSRADRPYRTIRFMEWVSTVQADRYFITGDNVGLAKKRLLSAGIENERITLLNPGMCSSMLEVLKQYINDHTVIYGCGNIKNAGFDIIKCFGE